MASPAPNERVNAFSIFAALAGLAGFVLAALAVVVVSVSDDDATVVSGGGTAAPTVSADLREFSITSPDEIPVGATIEVTNSGNVEHDLAVRGTDLATPLIASGGTARLDLSSLEAGTYEIYCTVAGHEAAGMLKTITISEDATVGEAADGGGHATHGREMTEEEADRLDELMMASMSVFPAETEGEGNLKLEPIEVTPDGVKVFELTAEIIDWEVEPGKFVEAWPYHGQVPAPWIDL